MDNESKNKYSKLTVLLPTELMKKAKIYSMKNDTTLKELCKEAISKFLSSKDAD